MRQNNGYVLKRIAKVPYLLPVGQLIADQRCGVRINETGVCLWNLLKEEHSIEELSRLCAAHYSAAPKDIPDIEKDVREFVSMLLDQDILISDTTSIRQSPESIRRLITIAGLTCMFHGPSCAFPSEFNSFLSESDDSCEPHQNIMIQEYVPSIHENGKLIIRNSELSIIECKDKYILLFPSSLQIAEAHLAKDASMCIFYCKGPFNNEFRENLFQAMKVPFLYLSQQHNMAALHSSSILYRERAWLFSAASGTGKSTHANLWHESLQTPIINGDLNLLAFENGNPVIHGIPWCGSSSIFNTHTYPLGGIILLRQSPSDFVEHLPEDLRRLLVLQRIISPSWNEKLYDISLRLADAMAEQILICRLHCTPQLKAVEAIRSEIDLFFQKIRSDS